jgi:hypothetical protein
MPENLLARKLKMKDGQKTLVLNAPAGFMETLKPYPGTPPETDAGVKNGVYDLVLLFVLNTKEINHFGDSAINALKKDGILWIAYPKLSSGIKSDLTRDEGWTFLDLYGLSAVSSIAIDDTWTGLRFKPATDGKSHSQRMAEYKARQQSAPKDRTVIVPADFQAALNHNPAAFQVFEKFAYTHRKEYVRWIEEAKKQETRENRIIKAVEKISAGGKMS